MEIMHGDACFRVEPGTTPNYDAGNSLVKLMGLVETVVLAESREYYDADQLQYLFPIRSLELYGPQGQDADVLDPAQQDNKTDFQKQNVRDFVLTDAFLVRGIVTAGGWSGPFLRLSYAGGPDSALAVAGGYPLGDRIGLWLKVGSAPSAAAAMLAVPYNPLSHRYEIELWGYPADDLRSRLDARGQAAMDRGELLVNLDLIHGDVLNFSREALEGRLVTGVAPTDAMHPVLPLTIELAWSTADSKAWDSQDGANYRYAFNMIRRGWDNYLGVGPSPNPHGGVGFLEYRNLLSNYGQYAGMNELARVLEPWMFDAFNSKQHARPAEPFMAVNYVDLHIMKGDCGIGLHRHRDNSEIFLMMRGRGWMVVGDWCKMPERERCFEVRVMRAGDMVMLRGGNLHGLMNPTDEDAFLSMFGGYD
jgi:mannose-6-phosphate isomerase-like protein (cupin superfamily)